MRQPDQASDSRQGTGFFDPIRHWIGITIALSVVAAVTAVVPFIAIVELARTLLPTLTRDPVDVGRVWVIVGVAVGSSVFSFISAGASGIVSHFADNDLQLSVRKRIVRHLQKLPLGWFDERSSGAVKKAVENDVSAIHELIAHAIHDFVTALAVPVLSIAYLLVTQWYFGVAAVVYILVPMVLYSIMVGGKAEKYAEYDASVIRLNAATIEYVHGIAVVKYFGRVGASHSRYRDETKRFVKFYGQWVREVSTMQGIVTIVTSPVVALLYFATIGTWLVGIGAVTPIDVLPSLLVGIGLTAPLLQLGFTVQYVRDAMKAKKNLEDFFAEQTMPQPEQPQIPNGHQIMVNDVSFTYDGMRKVLENIITECRPGAVTALVGPSGSGKSTLARLIARFYDTTEGNVCIGGVDVRNISPEELYSRVSFVFQDSYLLRTSVRENICLTRPYATDDQVEHAAKAAQIHDRILALPRGYDSVIGEDACLSGGEEQRLAIARALLTDAPVLILDEATAFADPDSEVAIQRALSALASQRTLVVIAHRLHTIVGADEILVLDHGRVAERGRHEDLAHAGGLYQSMWERYEKARSVSVGQGGQS